ncbi:arfaptin-1 isoform X2 [Hypomesus transpacificus]|uniref:arfaptin-1 isoform X2 n=2 Tax=Hypomesus transpacificus TaxID=137520 RepID=UPI001F0814D7|nr:arfaptin-1 isoform X2 [Hypomesus transpacificus]
MSEISLEAESGVVSDGALRMDSKNEAQNTEDSQSEGEEDSNRYPGAEHATVYKEHPDPVSHSVKDNVQGDKDDTGKRIEAHDDDDDDDDVEEDDDSDGGGGGAQISSEIPDSMETPDHGTAAPPSAVSFGSFSAGAETENDQTETADQSTPKEHFQDSPSCTKESTMTEEALRSPAAEISVTSNGGLDDGHEDVFTRDSSRGPPGALSVSEAHVSNSSFASAEGIIESGPYRGTMRGPSQSGAVVLADDLKNPAMEKLDLVRKWSVNTYKCTRQILSEKLGRGSRTVDLELEAQIEVLRDNKRKYENVVKLAQTLANQLSQMMQTQRQLGDAFADLSLKSPELHEEFGYNADTQKLLSKNGETLLGAITFFISSVNTLVDKTIEDTIINIKQYETARVEYDAYRTDLEELNLGPRDATTLPKIEQSQLQFQIHRDKYEKMRNDVSVKLKFLEENKVKVLHNQLTLFHNAIAAYYAGNQQQLEQTLKQFHIKLKMPGGDTPSWLEQH